MGEPVWTTLEIGGRITPATWAAIEPVLDEHWDESDDLALAAASNSPLRYSGQQNYGEVGQDLLDLLTKHNLTWKYHCEGVGGVTDARFTAWRPGLEEPLSGPCDEDGEPLITLKELIRAADEGHSIHAVIWVLTQNDVSVPPVILGEENTDV